MLERWGACVASASSLCESLRSAAATLAERDEAALKLFKAASASLLHSSASLPDEAALLSRLEARVQETLAATLERSSASAEALRLLLAEAGAVDGALRESLERRSQGASSQSAQAELRSALRAADGRAAQAVSQATSCEHRATAAESALGEAQAELQRLRLELSAVGAPQRPCWTALMRYPAGAREQSCAARATDAETRAAIAEAQRAAADDALAARHLVHASVFTAVPARIRQRATREPVGAAPIHALDDAELRLHEAVMRASRPAVERWTEHEVAWAAFVAAPPESLSSADIPWPPLDALEECLRAGQLPGLDLRKLRQVWHPDRFAQRFSARLDPAEREAVQRTVTEHAARLNTLA